MHLFSEHCIYKNIVIPLNSTQVPAVTEKLTATHGHRSAEKSRGDPFPSSFPSPPLRSRPLNPAML